MYGAYVYYGLRNFKLSGTDLGGDLFLWFLAWRELKRRRLLSGIRPTLRPNSLPGACALRSTSI